VDESSGFTHEMGMVVRPRGSRPHELLRNRIVWLVAMTLVVDLAGTTMAWMLERHDPHTGFTTWAGALFWTTAQLTTVSSQLPNPVTPGGKALDIVLEVWSVSVVATLAASLASFFTHRHIVEMKKEHR
jgi:hypothetical protein